MPITKDNSANLIKIFDFLSKIENLKSTLRYNKTTSGRTESSADHSWRLALMVFMVADELDLIINTEHSIKIALVHDLAEAIAGDIDAIKIAEGKITKEEKQRLELKAINDLKDILPDRIGNEIYDLWNEYEASQSQEAKFVKALDKIETLTQLAESGYKTYDNPEFIANYADKSVAIFPELKEMLKILKLRLKEEFIKGDFEWKEEYN